MLISFRKLSERYKYSRILLRQLVITEFKLRYQGSFLGYLWSLLKPLAIFSILYIVFVRFLKVGASIPYFAVYLLFGIVVWSFFVEITAGSVGAVVGRGDLIRKINFPKYVLIISSSISALINFLINLCVVLLFAVISGVDFRWTVIFIPLLLIELFVLCLGIAFFLSAAYVKFRDIGFIWEVVLQGAFYGTPILYPLDAPIPVAAQKILILNPIAQIIQDSRQVLITPVTRTIEDLYPTSAFRLIPVGIVIAIFVSSVMYFRKHSKSFAENV